MNLIKIVLCFTFFIVEQAVGQQMSEQWYRDKAISWEQARAQFPECASTGTFMTRILEIDAWAKENNTDLYYSSNKPFLLAQMVQRERDDLAAAQSSALAQREAASRAETIRQQESEQSQSTPVPPQVIAQDQTSGYTGHGGQASTDMSAIWLGRAIILIITFSIAWGLHWISKKKRGEIHSLLPASFGIRLGAHIIDAIVTCGLGFAVGFVIGYLLGGTKEAEFILIYATIAGGVSGWLYYAIMESSSNQATLGKMACGLLVTNLQGERISFGQASGRYFSRIVSLLTLYVGFIMCAWTKNRQCLHDMMAGCLVLDDGRSSGANIALTPPMRAPSSPALSPPPLTEALAANAQKVLVSVKLPISEDALNKPQRLPLIMNNIRFEVEIPEGEKLENGYVEMRHNTQYSLILRNHPWVPCDAEVVIDGIHVGTWRIESRGEIHIERPVHDTGHFTFFQVGTEEADMAGITKNPHNGLISVTFKPKKESGALFAGPLPGATGLTGKSSQRFVDATEIEHDMSRAFTIHIRLISKQPNIRPLAPRSTPIPPPVA